MRLLRSAASLLAPAHPGLLLRSLYVAATAAPPGGSLDADQATFYDNSVDAYARLPLREITLRDMLKTGQDAASSPQRIIDSAHIVQEELPKRLARRLRDLEFLPHIVVANPHIRRVYDAYRAAFHSIRDLPRVATLEDNAHLSAVLKRLIEEHTPMMDSLATGLQECHRKSGMSEHVQLDAFLDGMLRSRISRRVIAEQHVSLLSPRPHHVGIINTRLLIREAVELAAARARQVCAEAYGYAPEVIIIGDTALSLPQVSAHVDYVLYEVLKNALRAVVECAPRGDGYPTNGHRMDRTNRREQAHALNGGTDLPPVRVRICDGRGMTILRVSDQGGGLPRGQERRVWEYGFTTTGNDQAPPQGVDHMDESASGGPTLGDLMTPGTGDAGQNRLAGLGFGLPTARLTARYFGGNLELVNLPGYGVDAFLNLRHLEDWEWQEGPELQHPVMQVANAN